MGGKTSCGAIRLWPKKLSEVVVKLVSMNKTWDENQAAVLELRAPCTASVIGAPGTGKSALVVELAARIMREDPGARVALLSPDRRAASDLRNRISVELGYLPGTLQVQSLTAFAFGIVSTYAQFMGRREPELISGPAQDSLIKERFELALELGEAGIDEEVAQLPAYRAEFRDLLTRAAELELSPADLVDLARRYDEPIWEAGATVIKDYDLALATQSALGHANPDLVDHARVITQAAAMLRGWEAATPRGQGGLDIAKPRWDWAIVDDVQNATLALRTLLLALQEDGTSVVTFGDPDVAVQGFRGGIAHLPALLCKPAAGGGIGASQMVLGTGYRCDGQVRVLLDKVISGIHTAGVSGHRRHANAAEDGSTVRALTFPHGDEELAFVATELRRRHLEEQVPYANMAVISRSTSSHGSIRRTLLYYGVPVQTIVNDQPLREQRAVASIIELLEIALSDGPVEGERIEAMLTGLLFGIDPLRLRALMREMRGWELAAKGRRTKAELWQDIVAGGEVSAKIPEFARVTEVLSSIRQAAAAGGLGEEVLWAAWDGVGVAESWREQARAGGPAGDIADQDLDSVISLFRIAQRQADRDVTNATIHALLELLENQDLPEDSIARMGGGADEVALVSPSATVGREWDVVAIVGVNDGAWPNTRLRNPLTKVPKLVNIVVGSAMAGQDIEPSQLVSEVIDDELRMLAQAVSRARREVLITAQENDEARPSRFLTWLFPELERGKASPATLDEAGLVGKLRQALRSGDGHLEREAAVLLEELAAAGVRGADRSTWVDELALSTEEPVIAGDSALSPSRVEGLLKCPLSAFLDRSNATSEESGISAEIGTLIHGLAEDFPAGPREAIEQACAERISAIEFPDGLEGVLLRDRVNAMARNLGDYLENSAPYVLLEQEACASLDGKDHTINVSARIDRLEAVGFGVGVVDFKTGKQPITVKETGSNPQLLLYQWLLNAHGIKGYATSEGARLVYVGTGEGKVVVREQGPLEAEDLDQVAEMIRQADLAQRGPDYAALPGSHCRNCRYVSSCPAMGPGRIFS